MEPVWIWYAIHTYARPGGAGMSAAFYGWLAVSMVVFLTASAGLRAYIAQDRLWLLLGGLALYTIGNIIMVRLMRESGMAIAISLSAVIQLMMATAVAVAIFGERPTMIQTAGIALGVMAVALIVWPARGQG